MSDNPLAKYLPKQEDTRSYSLDLIDRANAQFSCLDILNKEYGYSIPHGGSGSTKQHCLWEWEHKDGGIERCMRYYWETDTAYCFRDHGVIDVVAIRSYQRGVSKVKAAKWLLQEAGIFNSDPWNVRIEKAQGSLKEDKKQGMDMRLAESMFNEGLRSVPGYVTLQYKTEIIQTKNNMLEEVDPAWDAQQLLSWIEYSKTRMRETVEKCLRKT